MRGARANACRESPAAQRVACACATKGHLIGAFCREVRGRRIDQTGTELASLSIKQPWRPRVTRAARTVGAAADDPAMHPLGKSPTYRWTANDTVVDMSMPLPQPRRTTIACEPQSVVLDLNRTALTLGYGCIMLEDCCA